MAIVLSQHVEASNSSGLTTQTLTLGSATSTGDHVILYVDSNATGLTLAVSGLGATWTLLQSGTPSREIWLLSGTGCAAGNTAITITVTVGSPSVLNYTASVWTGAGAVESSAIANGADFSPQTASVTPSSSALMVVGGVSQATGGTGTWTVLSDSPSAWTTMFNGTSLGFDLEGAGYITGTTAAATRTENSDHANSWVGWGVVLSVGAPPAPANRQPHVRVRSQAVTRAGVI